MEKIGIISLLCALLSLVSCGEPRGGGDLFGGIERLMAERPDSALARLRELGRREASLSTGERARYCLLLTEAEDKAYVRHTSDSVISIAVGYYAKRDDPSLYAKALYLKGRVCQEMKRSEEAASLYLQAEAAGDSSSIAYSYAYLGRVYGLEGDWRQAADNYGRAISVATACGSLPARSLAVGEYVAICVRAGWQDTANALIDDALRMDSTAWAGKDRASFFLSVGDTYRSGGDTARAVSYLRRALETDSWYVREGANQALAYLYEESGLYEKALCYMNQFMICRDSIREEENYEAVTAAEKRYNEERYLREKSQLESRNLRLTLGAFLLLVAVSVILYVGVREYREKMEGKDRIIAEVDDRVHLLRAELVRIAGNERSLADRNRELERTVGQLEGLVSVLQRIKMRVQSAMEESMAPVSVSLLSRMRQEPRKLSDAEWEELFILADQLHNKFLGRLSLSNSRD